MKIVMVAIGSLGDIYPLLGLSWEFRRLGHEVTFLSNEAHKTIIEKNEFKFVQISPAKEYYDCLDQVNFSSSTKVLQMVVDKLTFFHLTPVYEYLAKNCSAKDTLVIGSFICFGAKIAQEKLGIPYVIINLAPAAFISAHKPARFPTGFEVPSWLPISIVRGGVEVATKLADGYMGPKLNEYRESLGLSKQKRILEWMFTAELVVGLFPDWFAPSQSDWPANTVLTGFPLFDDATTKKFLPKELEDFLAEGTPPIIFTPGSPNRKAEKFFLAARDVCLSLKKRAIFLSKHSHHIPPDLPPEIRFFDYIPFSQVLPRSLAIVHHGGIGTCSQALQAGIPQVIVPWGVDQYDNVARLKKIGVAAEVPRNKCNKTYLERRLSKLIENPAVLENCRKYAEKLAKSNAVEDTCRLILESAGGKREMKHYDEYDFDAKDIGKILPFPFPKEEGGKTTRDWKICFENNRLMEKLNLQKITQDLHDKVEWKDLKNIQSDLDQNYYDITLNKLYCKKAICLEVSITHRGEETYEAIYLAPFRIICTLEKLLALEIESIEGLPRNEWQKYFVWQNNVLKMHESSH